MNELLTQEIGLQMWIVAATGILLLVFLGVLIWVITSIRTIQKPKFGFGGKPLPIISALLLTILLPISIYVVHQRIDFAQEAAALNDVSITIFELSDRETESEVSFSAIPIVSGKAWGEDKTFNLAWTITGPETVNYDEMNRSIQYPSYFVMSLDKGTYDISVRVTSDGFDITEASQFTVD